MRPVNVKKQLDYLTTAVGHTDITLHLLGVVSDLTNKLNEAIEKVNRPPQVKVIIENTDLEKTP